MTKHDTPLVDDERMQKEAALHLADQRFRLAVESIPDYAIYLLDAEGRVATWNAGARRNKGYDDAEVIGRHFGIFSTPEDRDAGVPERELEQAAREGRFEGECWRVRSDGTRFWANVVLTAMRDAEGRVSGFSKVTRDMTERRRQHDLLARVAETAPSAMLMADADGRITMVNAQAEAMFGYARADLLGRGIEALLPERFRGGHAANRAGFMQRASVRTMGAGRNLYALRSNGEEFPVDISLAPIDTAEGRAVLASIFDLTERKRQEELLARITEAAPTAMLTVDAAGRIVLVNAQAETMFGRPREQLVGQPIETLMPARYRAAHPGHRGGFMRQSSVRTMGAGRNLYALRGDGTEFPVDISLAPIETADGPAVVAAVFDLSERLAHQAGMERSLREKEVLLKEIHHRVKNNMQVISSLLQLQSGYIANAEALQVFEESQNRIKSMALVHEKLYQRHDLARIEMSDYVQSLVAMLMSTYGARAAGVVVDVRADSVALDVDHAVPAGLVLNELVSNALKHAFPNGRSGRVRIDVGPHEGDAVRLAVRDDGVGPPPGVDYANTNSLGLRLVHVLADQLGGTLAFAAGEGFGCELVFRPRSGARE